MGQKSNLNTLRLSFKRPVRLNTDMSSKQYLRGFFFINSLNQALKRKDMLLTNYSIKNNLLSNFFFLQVYIQNRKLINIRRLKTYNQKIGIINKKKLNKLNNFFNNSLWSKIFKTNLTIVKLQFLNKFVDKNFRSILLFQSKRYLNKLFRRKFFLFKDFLNLSSLLLQHKISAEIFVSFLALLFSKMSKYQHSQFFILIKNLFESLTTWPSSKIKGMRLVINGRIRGQLRSSTMILEHGRVGNQTMNNCVEYAKSTAFTIYGTYGFKLWVSFKE